MTTTVIREQMKFNKIELEKFEFLGDEPKVIARTPFKWMTKEEIADVKRYPYLIEISCPFSIYFKFNGTDIVLRGIIPELFKYNEADIPDLLQPIAFDRHSPFVKDASLIHDYILDNRERLWKTWELKEKGLSVWDFRKISSLVFGYQLEQNAVPHWKAVLMAFFTHLWQLVVPRWYKIK